VLSDAANSVTPIAWGRHWLYHALAEGASVTFATFIAGGLARERAAIGGLFGGLGITLLLAWSLQYRLVVGEPPYEWLITAIAGIAAPLVGYYALGEPAREVSTHKSSGFAGIHRLHFLWLWIPAYSYAASIIELIGKYINWYLTHGFIEWSFSDSPEILYWVPLIAFAIPAGVGIGLLSGGIDRARPMSPVVRQALAVVALAVGWCVAAVILVAIHQISQTIDTAH
jgi:hypothetical protein